MSALEQIEDAISKLPPEDFRKLAAWFDEVRAAAWDRQIEEDAGSGTLNRLYERLQKENKGEPPVPLNDFLDHEKLP